LSLSGDFTQNPRAFSDPEKFFNIDRRAGKGGQCNLPSREKGNGGPLFMPDLGLLLAPPNVFLTVGVIFISGAAVFAYTGKVWVRFSGWVYREKQPRVFWGEVAAYFLGGVFLVGYFLYRVA
jgi:hypothetical protein